VNLRGASAPRFFSFERHRSHDFFLQRLETGAAFFSFWHAASAVRVPFGSSARTGRRRCPPSARTHLTQWRIWL
jgi:hypothetical protein